MNGKKEKFYTFKPRVHRHNDPREYSKQLPRRFPREVSELCTDGLDEEEIEEKEELVEEINPKQKTLRKY